MPSVFRDSLKKNHGFLQFDLLSPDLAAMKKKKLSEGDTAACPYCGRTGLINEICADGSMVVIHRIVRKNVPSQATGAMIECSVCEDMCYRGLSKIREGLRSAA